MIKFKLCMVGSYAVGKTSLVERYVKSIYSDKYQTTIGVKIDKKSVVTDSVSADCIIWDIAGEDEFYTVRQSYLRGMSGYLLVVDGTRRLTVAVAERIQERVAQHQDVPFVLLVNKADLADDWEVSDQDLARLEGLAAATFRTSARTGDHVDEAFVCLVDIMAGART